MIYRKNDIWINRNTDLIKIDGQIDIDGKSRWAGIDRYRYINIQMQMNRWADSK